MTAGLAYYALRITDKLRMKSSASAGILIRLLDALRNLHIHYLLIAIILVGFGLLQEGGAVSYSSLHLPGLCGYAAYGWQVRAISCSLLLPAMLVETAGYLESRGTVSERIVFVLRQSGTWMTPLAIAVAGKINHNSARGKLPRLARQARVETDKNGRYRILLNQDDDMRAQGSLSTPNNREQEIDPEKSQLVAQEHSYSVLVPVSRCPRCGSSRISTPSPLAGKRHMCNHCKLCFNKPIESSPCPRCGSLYSRKKRVWQSKVTRRVIIELHCTHCNKDFLATPMLKYLRPKPYHLALALFLKFSAMTYKDISDFMWQFEGIVAPPSTLHDWITTYGPYAAELLADVHIPLAGVLLIDEMCETVRIEDEYGNYVRTDFWWIVNVYDPVNDIWRVGLVSRTRDANLAYEILDRIVTLFTKDKQCYKLFVKSDGLDIYEQARDKLAREGSLDPARIILISIPKESKNPHVTTDRAFINDIERFHTFVRALTRRMRKLKVFLSESAPQKWVDTARVHYNAVQTIRNPDGSRTTRIQNALPGFKQARNRWLEFIMQVLKLRTHVVEIKSQTQKAKQRAAEQRSNS